MADLGYPATMCEAFQATAARYPQEVALRTPGGAVTVTWGVYADRARQIAARHAIMAKYADVIETLYAAADEQAWSAGSVARAAAAAGQARRRQTRLAPEIPGRISPPRTAVSIAERTTLMTDDEQGIYGALPRLVQEFSGQLREATERLQGLAGLGGRVPPAAGALPLPGALSAAQMTAIADSIAAQRRSIEALHAQLTSFDEQLAALEQILGPMAEWSRTWAEFEQRLLAIGHRPADELLGGYRVRQEMCGLRRFLPLMIADMTGLPDFYLT